MKKRCHICNKELKNCGNHIYSCSNVGRHGSKIDKDRVKVEFLKYNYPFLFGVSDAAPLLKMYIDDKKALPEIRRDYDIDFKSICFLLQYFGIKIRSVKEASSLVETRDKYKNTCLERYGDINVLGKNSTVFEKRNHTVKNRYGVDNVFQIKEIINRINDDEKYLNKYGITRKELIGLKSRESWARLSDEQRMIRISASTRASRKALGLKNRGQSKIESLVREVLERFMINFVPQFEVRNGKKLYFFDFYLKKYNLLIEVNGNFWHANPSMYKETDMISITKDFCPAASDIWIKDRNKMLAGTKKGFKTVVLWEEDLNNCADFSSRSKLVLNTISGGLT